MPIVFIARLIFMIGILFYPLAVFLYDLYLKNFILFIYYAQFLLTITKSLLYTHFNLQYKLNGLVNSNIVFLCEILIYAFLSLHCSMWIQFFAKMHVKTHY